MNPQRQRAYERGLLRYKTGLPCRNGHYAERYVSTGGCVECLHPLKRMKNAFDAQAAPFVPQRLWVRNDYNEAERATLNTYLQQCIDTFDRAARPGLPPLIYNSEQFHASLPAPLAPTETLPPFAVLPSADRPPGRTLAPRCPHGVDEGYCVVCEEEAATRTKLTTSLRGEP